MPFIEISHFSYCRGCFFTKYLHFWFVGLLQSCFVEVLTTLAKSHFWGQKRRAVYRKYAIFRNFTFFSVQGVFIHQISPFLVFRLVIMLFCGSFKDFGEIPFLGPKTARCVPKICHFLKFHIFLSAGCVYSPNIAIFGFWACYKVVLRGSFKDFGKITFLGPKTARC